MHHGIFEKLINHFLILLQYLRIYMVALINTYVLLRYIYFLWLHMNILLLLKMA